MSRLNPSLLPRGVRWAQEAVRADALRFLYSAEYELVANAVARRRLEFATGRWLARRLLRELGCADAPLLADSRRAPLWPTGFVGSITHTGGWCAVAVARETDVASVGIDAEATLELDEDLWSQTLTADERRALTGSSELPPSGARQAAMQIFCAKEALYKAQYPLTGSWLGFEDAALELHQDGSFAIEIRQPVVQKRLASFRPRGGIDITDRITAAVTFTRL